MKYSVIIPIYNAEMYLEECVNSILIQKRNDVEIILVNDGSTDNSLNICKKIQLNNDNIILINKPNSGSMDSWIKGVEKSKGEYICFIDSDDKFSNLYFEKIDKIIEKDYDIIIYDFYKMFKNCEIKMKVNKIEYGKLSDETLARLKKNYFSCYKDYSLYRWDKVVKSDIIKKSIEEINCRSIYFEDHPISFLNLLNAKSIYYMNDALYYYRIRKSSVTHKYNDKVFEDFFKIENLMNQIAKKYKYNDEELYNIHLYFLYQYTRWSLKAPVFNNEKVVKMKDIIFIDGFDKKLVLLLYKFHLKFLYNFLNKTKNDKDKKNKEYFE